VYARFKIFKILMSNHIMEIKLFFIKERLMEQEYLTSISSIMSCYDKYSFLLLEEKKFHDKETLYH
jgi:hypothetical protein